MLNISNNSTKLCNDLLNLPLHLSGQYCKPQYSLRYIPNDLVNSYVGSDEYDHNGYLTELLITGHQLNPLFQDEAKKIFSNEYNNIHGIKCICTPAPVKAKKRCIAKASMDYKSKEYPQKKFAIMERDNNG